MTKGLVLQPVGELDADGCSKLRRSLSHALTDGARHIVIDLSEVTHLEIEAVGLLRGVNNYLRRLDGGLVVVRPSEAALRGLRVNELTDLLTLDDTPLAAVVPLPARTRVG
jgi:anti-anti-sigma factor